MITLQNLFLESWGEINRTLFVHKLENNSIGRGTLEALEALRDMRIITNTKDVYIYSFTHPDTNQVVSFTGNNILRPNSDHTVYYSYVSPIRNVLYKGGGGAMFQEFSGEAIHKKHFTTQSFLFSGETTKFTKIAEIENKMVSTSIPVPLGIGVGIHEKYDIKCNENKFNIRNIKFKKTKILTLPQMFLKSNYVFTYKTIVD